MTTRPATPALARVDMKSSPFTVLGAIVPSGAPMRALLQIQEERSRLVEALADVMRDQLKTVNLHQMAPGPRQRIEKARALLRSLGEAE
jgi:ABC-type Mn2+/Zn2+ transport system ATPase subunit